VLKNPEQIGLIPAPTQLLSIPDAAVFSGLSQSTLWRYIKRGALPKVQCGGPRCRVTVRREDLLALAQASYSTAAPTPSCLSPPKLSGRKPAWKQPA
jgi:predicted DNA-binding transcriptional regulator AlpA